MFANEQRIYDLKKKTNIQFDIIEKMQKDLQNKWESTQARKQLRSPLVSGDKPIDYFTPKNNQNDWKIVEA